VPFSTGSSTLPDEAFDKFPAIKTHGYRFQNVLFYSLNFPAVLRERIYAQDVSWG